MEINPINLDELKEKMPEQKKKRGRPAKKPTKTATDPVVSIENEEAEMKRLREQLLNYADHNPDIVEKPINNKILKIVNEMDIDELRARCRQGKKINSARMDSVVGRQVIQIANLAVGQLLDCLEELQESTKDDKLLNETVTAYLSLHVLDFIPEEIKIAGIYGSHTLTAYQESSKRKVKKPLPVKVEQPKVEEKKEEPKKEEIKLKNKDVEAFIPRIQEARDKLIRFKEELNSQ